MAFDVGNILNASLRNQLLAAKSTARQIEKVTLRLASGKKINSALDNPQSFFAARALNYRSADLTRLLDGIGQNIQVIKAADNGVTAGLHILDLAESYLNDIEQKLSNGELDLQETVDTTPPDNVTYIRPTGAGDFLTWGGGGQDVGGTITVSPDGNTFTFDGNMWKRLAVNYTVTADTVLEFDYSSSVRPEISGIGFDNDLSYSNSNTQFFLYGDQTSGVNYSAPTATYQYDGSGDTVHVEIPVGASFTGAFASLVFIHDDDGGGIDGNATFSNMFLREGPIPEPETTIDALQAVTDEYGTILDQLDQVAEDASYRGTNLLDDDDMTTFFNEHRTSKLVSEGIEATSAGLGLDRTGFGTVEEVQKKIGQIRIARETLRDYAATLASDLNVIALRGDFTRNMIAALDEGRDNLTLTDQNEDGAMMLALQTRQILQMSMMSFKQASILQII